MKAEELMIGDWMKFVDGVKVCVVVGIKCDARYLADEAIITVMDKKGKWFDKEMDFLKPIPLTPEILEKNGFEYLKTGEHWYLKEHKQKPIHVKRHQQDKWTFMINGNIIPCEYYYVHQLQHILKDCGINKQIEL